MVARRGSNTEGLPGVSGTKLTPEELWHRRARYWCRQAQHLERLLLRAEQYLLWALGDREEGRQPTPDEVAQLVRDVRNRRFDANKLRWSGEKE